MGLGLSQRLAKLRQQSGAPMDAQSGVAERVQRYRSRSADTGSSKASAQTLAQQLQGELVDDGVIVIERRVPLAARHGRIDLAGVLQDYAALPEAHQFDVRNAVFLDTETSGLAGGTGTVVFLLGLARIEGDALAIRQLHLTRFGAEARLFGLAAEWLNNAEGIVSFNGKTFDAPLLTTRHRLCGVHDPMARLKHLDLLHPTRRAFAKQWGDCRLATTERKLLGFEREDDMPGSMAPLAWFAWLRQNDATGLLGIARHNYWDVLSLAALVPALAQVYADPGAWDADVSAIARHCKARGETSRAEDLLGSHQAMLDTAGLLELARTHRRRKQWAQACAIWQTLAEEGNEKAIEALAKYHEHQCRDWQRALQYAQRLGRGAQQERRRERLRGKLADYRA